VLPPKTRAGDQTPMDPLRPEAGAAGASSGGHPKGQANGKAIDGRGEARRRITAQVVAPNVVEDLGLHRDLSLTQAISSMLDGPTVEENEGGSVGLGEDSFGPFQCPAWVKSPL